MISIVGSTLIFQGWRLDPLLLLCQVGGMGACGHIAALVALRRVWTRCICALAPAMLLAAKATMHHMALPDNRHGIACLVWRRPALRCGCAAGADDVGGVLVWAGDVPPALQGGGTGAGGKGAGKAWRW